MNDAFYQYINPEAVKLTGTLANLRYKKDTQVQVKVTQTYIHVDTLFI